MTRNLLAAEARAELIALFMQRYGRRLRDEQIDVVANLHDGTVLVTLILARRDKTFEYCMEVAKDVPESGKLTLDETMELCIDFLDWYLGEYFDKDRDLLLPLDFQTHSFGDFEVLARGDVKNPLLDGAAEAWLRGERPEEPVKSKDRQQ